MSSLALTQEPGSALWYLSRATGATTLALLTVVVLLGVLTQRGHALPGQPRFVVAAAHRNAALLSLVFLGGHILTAVLDPYASLRVVDAVIPFVSSYRPIWLGLGALAFDLLLAVVVTSLLRLRLGRRVFRAAHWLTYAAWPVALVHALGTGTDVRSPWLLLLAGGSVVSVGIAVLYRAATAKNVSSGRRAAVATTAVLAPVALAAWLVTGPLAPHWAARSGTPKSLISGGAAPAGAAEGSTGAAFNRPGAGSAGASPGEHEDGGERGEHETSEGE